MNNKSNSNNNDWNNRCNKNNGYFSCNNGYNGCKSSNGKGIYRLINEQELKRLYTENPAMDTLEIVKTATLQMMEQLQQIEMQLAQTRPQGEELLEQYASLRPTELQLHRALLCVMGMNHPTDSTRKLIYRKSHWLAVMRALQFLGVISTEYGSRQEFVDYIHRTLGVHAPQLSADNFKSIESESPFNRQLPIWVARREKKRLSYYRDIAIAFLNLLSPAADTAR